MNDTLYAYIRRECPTLNHVRAERAAIEVIARRPDNARDVWVSLKMYRPNGRKHAEALEIIDTTIYFTWE